MNKTDEVFKEKHTGRLLTYDKISNDLEKNGVEHEILVDNYGRAIRFSLLEIKKERKRKLELKKMQLTLFG